MSKLKYQSSRLFNLFTVIVLTCLCLLLNFLTKIDFHKLELPKDKPEFSATGIVADLYDPEGRHLYKVLAESGTRFPEGSQISLNKLDFQAFNESTGLLSQQLTSKNGWLDPESALGYLGESVVITSYDNDPQKIIKVYTHDVVINSKNKTAQSSAPILAVQGKSTLTGVGFHLDYDKKFLVIESNVKVVYVTN